MPNRFESCPDYLKLKVMKQFEENNPEQLKEFIKQFYILMDNYHANTYLIDGVWEGAKQIENAIQNELNKETK
jgi:hypothetical protein